MLCRSYIRRSAYELNVCRKFRARTADRWKRGRNHEGIKKQLQKVQGQGKVRVGVLAVLFVKELYVQHPL